MAENATTERQIRPANKRGAARLAAVQALYQMDLVGTSVLDIASEYEQFRLGREIDGEQYLDADSAWFRSIIAGVVKDQKTIDPILNEHLPENWTLARIDSTLRAILRAATYELREKKDVPIAVIVTEYVDVARAFYDGDEPKIVNAALDRIGKRLRGETADPDRSIRPDEH